MLIDFTIFLPAHMENQNINFGFVFNFADRDLIAREKHNKTCDIFLKFDFSDFVNAIS